MKKIYIAVLILFSGIASSGIAQNGEFVLPKIKELRMLIGMTTNDMEFSVFEKKYNLRIYKKEDIWSEDIRDKNKAIRTIKYWYAGHGYVLIAIKHGRINVENETWLKEPRVEVSSVELVFGPCEEQRRFGVWHGESPEVYIPKNPNDLIAKLKRVDYDVSIWHLTHGNVDIKDRTMQETIDYNRELYQYTFTNDVFVKLRIPRITKRS